MSKNRVNSPRFLPVPTRGIDLRIPITSMPPQYSPFMINFHVGSGRIRRRKPHRLKGYGANAETKIPTIVPLPTSDRVITIGDAYTEDSAGTTPVATPAGIGTAAYADWTFMSSTLMVSGNGNVYQLNTSTLAWTLAFTFSSLDDRNPICSYRERLYVGGLTTLYYGGVGAISGGGAMTGFSLTSLLNGSIAAIGSFNYSTGLNRESVLVIVDRKGIVLVYGGSYPGGTDWYLINRFDLGIGELDAEHPYEMISIEGDLLINPKFSHQVFSVKALLTEGVGKSEWQPLEKVQAIWDDALANTSYAFKGVKSIAYWPQRTAVIVQVRLYEVEMSAYLDRWTDVSLPGFKDDAGTDHYCFLLHCDLGNDVVTIHNYPTTAEAMGTNYSEYTQLRSGLSGVFAPDMITLSAVKRCASVSLFDELTSVFEDWDGSTADTTTYTSYALFAPLANHSDQEAVHNAVMFSNLNSSHVFSFGISANFDHSPATTFESFVSTSSSVVAKQDILPARIVDTGLIFQIKEASPADESYISWSQFECYGIRLIPEVGGLY